MSKHADFIPFKEYPSTLERYSNSDQLQARQYKSIIESSKGQAAFHKQHYDTFNDATQGRLNANVPVSNKTVKISIDGKPINVYEQFWQYKHNGGTIFTDWTSAGVANLNTDIAISHMPLYGDPKLRDPNLVLSNTNNVRNNLQRYGKEYLTTTNLLNSIAFKNGISYESGAISPLRTGRRTELEQLEHSNFNNNENGDLYSRQIQQLDVTVPITYANNTRSHWVYINPSFIRPRENPDVPNLKFKYGIFDLDSMKITGTDCLTKNFNITPIGLDKAVDVLNDDRNYPPVSDPNYYTNMRDGIEDGIGSNMYCSANTNYVAMPKNNVYNNLDTSFQVMPGTNSITLGTVMSPRLKDFIRNELFNLNRDIILMQVYHQYRNNPENKHILNHLKNKYPQLFKDTDGKTTLYEYYMNLSEHNKYDWVFNNQKHLSSVYHNHHEVAIFIDHLSIFKFSGPDVNNKYEKGSVLFREINDIFGLNRTESIIIDNPGCFLLLPTMLNKDVFGVRENIPEEVSGNIEQINNYTRHSQNYTPIVNNSKDVNDPNECITHTNPWDYKLNATNCAFRDSAGKWIQKEHPNFIPNMFNDPSNLNNDISNLDNRYVGINPYNAPSTF